MGRIVQMFQRCLNWKAQPSIWKWWTLRGFSVNSYNVTSYDQEHNSFRVLKPFPLKFENYKKGFLLYTMNYLFLIFSYLIIVHIDTLISFIRVLYKWTSERWCQRPYQFHNQQRWSMDEGETVQATNRDIPRFRFDVSLPPGRLARGNGPRWSGLADTYMNTNAYSKDYSLFAHSPSPDLVQFNSFHIKFVYMKESTNSS